jgi:hypothetical protein
MIGNLLAERRNPPTGAMLQAWLEDHVLPAFPERILPVYTTVARRASRPPRPAGARRMNRSLMMAEAGALHPLMALPGEHAVGELAMAWSSPRPRPQSLAWIRRWRAIPSARAFSTGRGSTWCAIRRPQTGRRRC